MWGEDDEEEWDKAWGDNAWAVLGIRDEIKYSAGSDMNGTAKLSSSWCEERKMLLGKSGLNVVYAEMENNSHERLGPSCNVPV